MKSTLHDTSTTRARIEDTYKQNRGTEIVPQARQVQITDESRDFRVSWPKSQIPFRVRHMAVKDRPILVRSLKIKRDEQGDSLETMTRTGRTASRGGRPWEPTVGQASRRPFGGRHGRSDLEIPLWGYARPRPQMSAFRYSRLNSVIVTFVF